MLDSFKSVLKRKLDAELYGEPRAEPTSPIDKKQLMHTDLTEYRRPSKDAGVTARGQSGQFERNTILSNDNTVQQSALRGVKVACNSPAPSISTGSRSGWRPYSPRTPLSPTDPNDSTSNLPTLSTPISPQKPQIGLRTLFTREIAAAYQIHWRYHTGFPVPPLAELLNWINTNWEWLQGEWEEILRSNETPSETLERQKSVELYYSTAEKVAAAEHLRHARTKIRALVFKRKKAKIRVRQAQNKVSEDTKKAELRRRWNSDVYTPSPGESVNGDQEADFGRKEEDSEQDGVSGESLSRNFPTGVVVEYVHPTPGELRLRGTPQFRSLERHMVLIESRLRFRISAKKGD